MGTLTMKMKLLVGAVFHTTPRNRPMCTRIVRFKIDLGTHRSSILSELV